MEALSSAASIAAVFLKGSRDPDPAPLGANFSPLASSCHVATICEINKKDGYRQQNVRQRQKLISIIDHDVCILEYLQPFWRFSTSKNGLTLKSGYWVLQGH